MHDSLTVGVELLLLAAIVGIVAKRARIHYNIALVFAGVVVSLSPLFRAVVLDPDVVLQLFLPILLMEAAIATDVGRLRENLAPVVLLAVPGLIASVLVAGFVLHTAIGYDWAPALLLGSILATTDTIAVIGTFRKVRVPGRLETIVENESLFNDGTALVAFTTLLGVVREGSFDPQQGLLSLAWVTGAGLAVGGAVGWVASLVMHRTGDHLVEIMLTVLAAYGSSVLAETIHGSPVLAVVVAGLVVGNLGWKGLAPTGKLTIRTFWEVASFGVNSVVFLLIGLQVDFRVLLSAAPLIGWGLLALTLGRATAVYPFLALLSRSRQRVPLVWQHLLVWGNLKGSLSMALVLSLPATVADRDSFTAIVFGCTFVTLTAQGLSLAPLIRRSRIAQASDAERRIEANQGQLMAARAGQAELDRLQRLGLLPLGVFQSMRAAYQGVIARSERGLRDLLMVHSRESAHHIRALRRRLLTVEKSALRDAVSAGILSADVAEELTAEIDRALVGIDENGGG